MAAVVVIKSAHDATGSTVATVTAIRFKKADNDTADTNNRMPIPAAGTEYSYLKHLYLNVDSGAYTLIDTLRAYGDGALPTGVGVCMADAAYANPVANADTVLGAYSNNYAGYTSAAPLSLAGSAASSATGKINTNYLQMQMGVGSGAASGVMTAETLTFSYLES